MGLMSVDSYKSLLASFFPAGAAWNLLNDFYLKKLSDGFANEMERIDNRAIDLINDHDPRTTTESLTDYERLLALPEKGQALGTTNEIRQNDVVSKLTNFGGQSKNYFIYLAERIGITITIIEYVVPKCARVRCGDRLTAGAWAFAFKIIPSDVLSSENLDRLRKLINRYKPAHTIAIFTDNTDLLYSGSARAGDRLRIFY